MINIKPTIYYSRLLQDTLYSSPYISIHNLIPHDGKRLQEFYENVINNKKDSLKVVSSTSCTGDTSTEMFFDGTSVDVYRYIRNLEDKRVTPIIYKGVTMEKDEISGVSNYYLIGSEKEFITTLYSFLTFYLNFYSKTFSLDEELKKIVEIQPTDVISLPPSQNKNIERFTQFYSNFNKGIKDFVRVVTFGIEGQPTIRSINYDGNIIEAILYHHDTYLGAGKEVHIQKYKGKFISIEENHGRINYNLLDEFGHELTKLCSYMYPKLKFSHA